MAKTTKQGLPSNPKITPVTPDHLPKDQQEVTLPQPVSQEEIQVFAQALRQVKRPRSTAPTNTPQNFLQQIEFYDDGVNRRVYFYVGGSWRYAALT